MGREKKLWITFILITTVSFAVLGYFGYEIYQKAPPLPSRVITTEGKVIFEGQDIKDGQNVWQSIGGQEVVLFGAMAPTLHRIGQQIGCTVNLFLS